MTRPDIDPVAAFLEPRHSQVAAAVNTFGQNQLVRKPDPDTDAEARIRARALVPLLAAAGLVQRDDDVGGGGGEVGGRIVEGQVAVLADADEGDVVADQHRYLET